MLHVHCHKLDQALDAWQPFHWYDTLIGHKQTCHLATGRLPAALLDTENCKPTDASRKLTAVKFKVNTERFL